jgi:hypothetical protein
VHDPQTAVPVRKKIAPQPKRGTIFDN